MLRHNIGLTSAVNKRLYDLHGQLKGEAKRQADIALKRKIKAGAWLGFWSGLLAFTLFLMVYYGLTEHMK